MPPRWPVGQCRVCLGWGENPQYADCGACSSWRQLHPDRAPCRRCGHDSHVNTDGLCRLCLLTIRLHDPEWIADPAVGRPSQLMLILPGDRLPTAQPLDRPLRGRAPDRTRPRSLLDQLRIASAEPIDDPRICPPAIRGQLLLFRPRRQLTDAHARRIKHRDFAGYNRLRETAIGLAAERGLSTAWWRGTCLMLRLALAIREADGDDHVPEEARDDLPRFRNAVADVLRRAGLTGAGMLRPRRGTRPVLLRNPQRSCKHCDCWGSRTVCEGCSSWMHQNHPVGDCTRCGRGAIPLLGGLCRACCLHVDQHGSHARTQTWTQLWSGGELAPRLAVRTGTLGYVAPQQKAAWLYAHACHGGDREAPGPGALRLDHLHDAEKRSIGLILIGYGPIPGAPGPVAAGNVLGLGYRVSRQRPPTPAGHPALDRCAYLCRTGRQSSPVVAAMGSGQVISPVRRHPRPEPSSPRGRGSRHGAPKR